jgi:hypothetical protein
MLDWLIHWGALIFIVAAPIAGATTRAVRDHRHRERGEVASVVVGEGLVWGPPGDPDA